MYKKTSLLSIVLIITWALLLVQCSKSEKTSTKQSKQPYVQDQKGIWFSTTTNHDKNYSSKNTTDNINKLKTLGYLSGYHPSPAKSGVTIYERDKTYDGINLIVSGHKPYAALLDMKGNTLHSWTFDYSDLHITTEELIVNRDVDENFKNYWRRVHLFKNGDILAIYDYQAMVKLDKDSNLLWIYPSRTHHDLFTDDNNNIWVLTTEKKMVPSISPDKPVFEDHICQLSQEGKEIRKISVLSCFMNSEYAGYLKKVMTKNENAVALDIFHTNAIKMSDGRLYKKNSAFKKGNIIISVRELNLLAVVDPDQEKVVWVTKGPWKAQHEPKILANGNMIVFDNKGGGNYSRVLEFDPFKPNKIIWSFQGKPPEIFNSPIVGSEQILPNGNILITDTAGGKAFETTYTDQQIVWQYVNTHRAGPKNELIAALFDTIRLSKDFSLKWLDHPPAN